MPGLITQQSSRAADSRQLTSHAGQLSPALTSAVVWCVWLGLLGGYGTVCGRAILRLAVTHWSRVQTPLELQHALRQQLLDVGVTAAIPLVTSVLLILAIQRLRLWMVARRERAQRQDDSTPQTSQRHMLATVQLVVSTIVIAATATLAVRQVGISMEGLVSAPLQEGLDAARQIAWQSMLLLAAGLLVTGLIDAAARRWAGRPSDASSQQQRQQLRDLEGDPEVARRRKAMHRALLSHNP